MTTITIDPITRIEGHLKLEALVENGQVADARSSGTLFRGIELILRGRDPRDAPLITQRICGVCPIAHAMASTLCLDDAFGISEIPPNGRIIRNLILGANYIQSHILHFYHLAALDFVDVSAAAGYAGRDPALNSLKGFVERGQLGPFLPRYEGDYRLSEDANVEATAHYVQALDARRQAHEMLAIFGGKMPHQVGIVPGGATQTVTADRITNFLWRLNALRDFIDSVYLPDVVAIAGAYPDYFDIGAGCGRFLSYGAFDLGPRNGSPTGNRWLEAGICQSDLATRELDPAGIREDVAFSWYADATNGKHPSEGDTCPEPDKASGYSWLKAPRYEGSPHEVGPLARIMVNYARGQQAVVRAVDELLSALGLPVAKLISVLGRHAARALECKLVADAMADWVLQLDPDGPSYVGYALPEEAVGVGLTAAPRGAVGHWISIRNGVIENYQAVVPTTWNCSPRDAQGQPGPAEQALIGTRVRDAENPFELVRIIRSFDPCLACSVHTATCKPGVEAHHGRS